MGVGMAPVGVAAQKARAPPSDSGQESLVLCLRRLESRPSLLTGPEVPPAAGEAEPQLCPGPPGPPHPPACVRP